MHPTIIVRCAYFAPAPHQRDGAILQFGGTPHAEPIDMKATTLLIEQDQKLRTLLRRLRKQKGNADQLLKILSHELITLMVIEQQLLYPWVAKKSHQAVLEAQEQHALLRFSLKRVMSCPPKDPSFIAKVVSLETLSRRSARAKGKHLYPEVERALGKRSQLLCRKMKDMYKSAQKEGYEKVLNGRSGKHDMVS